MKDNIILIGFMGCGKSSVGKKLANKMSYSFCDTDELIERKEKMKISEIFNTKGEEYFRKLETTTIKDMANTTNRTIISTGGGLPLRKENSEILRKLGLVVYLKASKRIIIQRVSSDNKRPLLAKGNIEEKVEKLLKERNPIYEEVANTSITTDDKTFFKIINEILGCYNKKYRIK